MTATSTVDEPPARTAGHPPRLAALDGLRGLAVVAVVLYHGGHLRGGFLGVDLFFVLSGFLITTILVRSWSSQRRIDLGRFWSRRARRLLPAMLAMLVVVAPVYASWFATGTELTLMRRDGISMLLYVTNWQQIHYDQVYGAANLVSPFRHAWSLAVEEQFYVVWPLAVLFLLRRRGTSLVRTVAPALAVASAALTIVIARSGTFSHNSLYLGTHSRAAALLAGASLAVWAAPRRRAGTRARPRPNLPLEAAAVVAFGVLVVMCAVVTVEGDFLYSGGLVISAIASTVLVAAAAQPAPGPIVNVLTAAPLRWLGTTSYGIYLWSWPIMQMVSAKHTPLDGWPLLAVQVALTLAAASASWYLLEKPILAGALRPPTGQKVLAVALVVALVVVVGSTKDAKPLVSDEQSTAGYTGTGATRLLVVGDSVPARIADEGIAPLAGELDVSVVDRSIPGCILLREAGRVKGSEGNIRSDVTPCNQGWRTLATDLRPDVVLVLFGQFAADQVELDGSFRRPCDPEYRDAERSALDAGIDDLASDGARVVLATAPGTSVDWILEGSPEINDQMTCLNTLYQEVAEARDDTDVVDFATLVCPEPGNCLDTLDSVNLREDTVHFQGESAELVARWLVPRVLGQDPGPAAPSKRVPYCDTIEGLFESLATSSQQAPATDTVLSPETLELLRNLPVASFTEGLPEEIAPAILTLLQDKDALFERLAELPADTSQDELLAVLGDSVDQLEVLTGWYTDTCQ